MRDRAAGALCRRIDQLIECRFRSVLQYMWGANAPKPEVLFLAFMFCWAFFLDFLELVSPFRVMRKPLLFLSVAQRRRKYYYFTSTLRRSTFHEEEEEDVYFILIIFE